MSLPSFIHADQDAFVTSLRLFESGQLELSEFKPLRARFGIYEQRQAGTYMLRPRIPSGCLTLQQFQGIVAIARQHSLSSLHLTTRQDIQFHGLRLHEIPDVMQALAALGLSCKGTGGNTARNIAASPLAGKSQDDVFDVIPYALASGEHMLVDPTYCQLPRKFKISFSNSPADTAGATLSDLGLIASVRDGLPGFAVYGGGGLGPSPNPALLLSEFLPAGQFLAIIESMKRLFEREGDWTNRNKARIRYILKRLGDDAFRTFFFKILDEVLETTSLEAVSELFVRKTQAELMARQCKEVPSRLSLPLHVQTDTRVVALREPGYYAVNLHPVNGQLELDAIAEILAWLDTLDHVIQIRLDTTQSLMILDLTEEEMQALLQLTALWTRPEAVYQSVACTGASTCQLGIGQSQTLLRSILDRLDQEPGATVTCLPRLMISGCPNSCGQHQKGLIGLSGFVKRVGGQEIPAYRVSLGGKTGQGVTRLGSAVVEWPASQIPDLIAALAHFLEQEQTPDFSTCLELKGDVLADWFSRQIVVWA